MITKRYGRISVGALGALVLMTLALSAHAQFGGGGFGGGGGGRGGGMGGAARPPTVWQQLRLDAEGLTFTRDQKRSVEDLVDAFEKEVRDIAGRDRVISPEEQTRVAAAQEKLVAAITAAMTETQREVWVAARAAPAPQPQGGGFGGRGGGGPPGGGGGFGGR